ncbi:hypothetical protein ES703_31408 [subsurface metagenome]
MKNRLTEIYRDLPAWVSEKKLKKYEEKEERNNQIYPIYPKNIQGQQKIKQNNNKNVK